MSNYNKGHFHYEMKTSRYRDPFVNVELKRDRYFHMLLLFHFARCWLLFCTFRGKT